MIGQDTRAVSVTVTHALMLGITSLLVTGLLIGTGTLLENQRERAAGQQVDEVGADVLAHVDRLARLNESGETVTASVRLDYPRTIGGDPYTVSLTDDGGPLATEWTVRIDADGLGRTVHYPVPNGTSLAETRVRGDEPQLSLCANGTIMLGDC